MKVLGHLVLGVIWRGNETKIMLYDMYINECDELYDACQLLARGRGPSDSDEGSDMYAYRQTAWQEDDVVQAIRHWLTKCHIDLMREIPVECKSLC